MKPLLYQYTVENISIAATLGKRHYCRYTGVATLQGFRSRIRVCSNQLSRLSSKVSELKPALDFPFETCLGCFLQLHSTLKTGMDSGLKHTHAQAQMQHRLPTCPTESVSSGMLISAGPSSFQTCFTTAMAPSLHSSDAFSSASNSSALSLS